MPVTRSSKAPRTVIQHPSNRRIKFSNALPSGNVFSDDVRTVLVCGDAGDGQLGLGDGVEAPRPKINSFVEELNQSRRTGDHGVEQVAAGGMHSLLLDSLGQVWSFGVNDEMALGRITKGLTIQSAELESKPDLVQGLEAFRAVAIAASDNLSLALNDKGELRTWGIFKYADGGTGYVGDKNMAVHPSVPKSLAKVPIIQISCGANHILALSSSGKVYTWGDDSQSRLGRKVLISHPLSGLRPEPLGLKNIVAVGTGSYTSFAVNHHGVVYAFGLNNHGQTGVNGEKGKNKHIESPTPVDTLDPKRHGGARVVQISGGDDHTIFLFDNGQVWGCGSSQEFCMGLPKTHPSMLESQARYEQQIRVMLAARPEEQVALDDDPWIVRTPMRIPFPLAQNGHEMRIKAISAGERYCLACDEDGDLYSWGTGTSGQLGHGPSCEAVESSTRVRSKGLDTHKILQVSAGGQHVLLLGALK